MLRPTIDSDAIKALVKELNKVEPGLARQLTKDLKTELIPVATRIQPFIPNRAPLSGMVGDGRLSFAQLRVGVSATPGAGWGRPFAKFTLAGKREANAKMIEFAGKRSNGKTPQGRAMIENLDLYPNSGDKKTGRFFFEGYRRNRKGLLNSVQHILDRYTKIVNRSLNNGI